MERSGKRELIGMEIPFVGHCVLSDLRELPSLTSLEDQFIASVSKSIGNPSWSVLLYRMGLFESEKPQVEVIPTYEGSVYLGFPQDRVQAYSRVLPGAIDFMRATRARFAEQFSPCLASFVLTAFRDTAPLK